MNCIKCGRETAGYHFKVLQVQTLHVRDLNKAKRVQALGGFEEYDVCAACAEEKYNKHMDNRAAVRKTIVLYGAMILVGLVLTIFFWNAMAAFRMTGLGLTIGGGLCLYYGIYSAGARKREMSALSREDALYRCAWECLIDGAPKKNDINDITYIPVDEETLARKNGDLMILYDLLPEIAVQAHKRIHGIEE